MPCGYCQSVTRIEAIAPRIVRDLQVCDLMKVRVSLLEKSALEKDVLITGQARELSSQSGQIVAAEKKGKRLCRAVKILVGVAVTEGAIIYILVR